MRVMTMIMWFASSVWALMGAVIAVRGYIDPVNLPGGMSLAAVSISAAFFWACAGAFGWCLWDSHVKRLMVLLVPGAWERAEDKKDF